MLWNNNETVKPALSMMKIVRVTLLEVKDSFLIAGHRRMSHTSRI